MLPRRIMAEANFRQKAAAVVHDEATTTAKNRGSGKNTIIYIVHLIIFLNNWDLQAIMADEATVKEKLSKGYLMINMVIEIVGTPKEHVEDTLRLVLKKLREEEGVDVQNGKVYEPKSQGNFFSTFAELNVLIKDFATITSICFNYMPSSIEILEPAQFKLVPLDMANMLNDILARLHETDMRLKNTNAVNILLEKNLYNLLKHAVLLTLGAGKKTAAELSEGVGISDVQLEPFLTKFEEEKLIKKEGNGFLAVVKRPNQDSAANNDIQP
jgi:hypothetical protein